MVSASSLAIISLPFIRLAAIFIMAALDPQTWDTGNSTTTKPVQTYNFPKLNKTLPSIGELTRRNATIGDWINMTLTRSNAGFLYHSLAAEEERPEPGASLTR
jgi:hypothetical protein